MHKSITLAKVKSAVRAADRGTAWRGYCTACGTVHTGVEPDARQRPCTKCGKPAVYGAEELLIALSFC